jgi:outer membrane protein assembly factor BamB
LEVGHYKADYATVKYSPEGKKLWARRYHGPGNDDDIPSSLAVDGQGNVYVTGGSLGTGKKFESATIKYSPEGRRLWLRRNRASATEDYSPRSLALDSQGNVYITGRAGLPGTFEENYLTVKYKQAP